MVNCLGAKLVEGNNTLLVDTLARNISQLGYVAEVDCKEKDN